MQSYNHRNCQSLFGYGQSVHLRCMYVCQLCGCDATGDYDLFKQFSVEHLIGDSQGGYLRDVRLAVAERFPALSSGEQERIAAAIDEANTVTACHFCNSTTSRNRNEKTLNKLLSEADGTPGEVVAVVAAALAVVLARKQSEVRIKDQAVRKAFESEILPAMLSNHALP